MLKRLLCLGMLILAFGATGAEPINWLTIVGDPLNAQADTIEIDPVVRSTKGPLRVMGLRVSRSVLRTSVGGVDFRSYEGSVEFDCDKLTARFVRSQFYNEPLWQQPGALVDFPPSNVRPMAFRRFEPNPRDKVIRAACLSYKP